jgi:hypothetical protein
VHPGTNYARINNEAGLVVGTAHCVREGRLDFYHVVTSIYILYDKAYDIEVYSYHSWVLRESTDEVRYESNTLCAETF